MTKFIFDLDGTVTREETLPIIAQHFRVEEEIAALTKETIQGNVPFIESFIRRVYILGRLPISEIATLLAKVELYPQLLAFIQQHREACCIATGNLSCWTEMLAAKIGCGFYGSEAQVQDDYIVKLTAILRKEEIVAHYKAEGYKVVFIGDGNNDVEAMRQADTAIASALTHMPTTGVLSVADYLVVSEAALCRQLNQLL